MVYFTVLDSRFQPYIDNSIQAVGVSGYITNLQGQILIIKRAAHDTAPGRWETPGGGIEWGEHPADAIKREVKEECGLDVNVEEVYTVLSWTSVTNLHRHNIQIIYKCNMLNKDQKVVLSRDHAEYRWAVPSELKGQFISNFLQSLIK